MTEMYVAAGIVVYVLGGAIGAWGAGRFTGEDGDEPQVVLPLIFWPLVIVALPVLGLIYGTIHAFGWGRRRRDIEARKQEYLEQTARELARKESSTPSRSYSDNFS